MGVVPICTEIVFLIQIIMDRNYIEMCWASLLVILVSKWLRLVWLNPKYWAPFSLYVGQVPYGSHEVNFFPSVRTWHLKQHCRIMRHQWVREVWWKGHSRKHTLTLSFLALCILIDNWVEYWYQHSKYTEQKGNILVHPPESKLNTDSQISKNVTDSNTVSSFCIHGGCLAETDCWITQDWILSL